MEPEYLHGGVAPGLAVAGITKVRVQYPATVPGLHKAGNIVVVVHPAQRIVGRVALDGAVGQIGTAGASGGRCGVAAIARLREVRQVVVGQLHEGGLLRLGGEGTRILHGGQVVQFADQIHGVQEAVAGGAGEYPGITVGGVRHALEDKGIAAVQAGIQAVQQLAPGGDVVAIVHGLELRRQKELCIARE